MEFNKISAAAILSLLVAWLAGFTADKLVHPEMLQENAFKIEGVISTAHAAEPTNAAAPAAAAEVALPPIEPLLASADPAKGEQLVKACAACHSFNQGGPNKVGPNLWGVFGNHRAHLGDAFAYSQAMKSAGGEWTAENLNAFLHKPRVAIAGTKMAYAGMSKPEDRAAVIAYLKTLK